MLTQVSAENKKKALEAKARGDEAFKRKEFMLAIDAYTQVSYPFVTWIISCRWTINWMCGNWGALLISTAVIDGTMHLHRFLCSLEEHVTYVLLYASFEKKYRLGCKEVVVIDKLSFESDMKGAYLCRQVILILPIQYFCPIVVCAGCD